MDLVVASTAQSLFGCCPTDVFRTVLPFSHRIRTELLWPMDCEGKLHVSSPAASLKSLCDHTVVAALPAGSWSESTWSRTPFGVAEE